MILALGALSDFDNTCFNGVAVGHTGHQDGQLAAHTAQLRGARKTWSRPAKMSSPCGFSIASVTVALWASRAFGCGQPVGISKQHWPASWLQMSLSPKPEGAGSLGILLSRLSSRPSRWEIIPTATTGGRYAGILWKGIGWKWYHSIRWQR